MQVTVFLFLQHRLEDLFLIEEDVKREDEKEDEPEESADSLAAKQSQITHPQVRSLRDYSTLKNVNVNQ